MAHFYPRLYPWISCTYILFLLLHCHFTGIFFSQHWCTALFTWKIFLIPVSILSEKELTWADLDELSACVFHLTRIFSLFSLVIVSSHLSSVSPLLFSTLSPLTSPALRDSFREREQLNPASSHALDGPPGSTPTPGMTISHRGEPTAASSTSSSAALAPNFGHSLCNHSSSGWESLRASCIFCFLCRSPFSGLLFFLVL